MPLTAKGRKIMAEMVDEYGKDKGIQIFYASRNKGTITGVDPHSLIKNKFKAKRKRKGR